jgi:hypothetical protein
MKELNISQVELDALWSFVKKNSLRQKSDSLEGEVWIGVAFAKEYRLMLSFTIDAQEPWLAESLVEKTERSLRKGSWPVWVSDGMDAYGEALKSRHCIVS